MSTVIEDGGILPDLDAGEAWRYVLALTLMTLSVGSNESFPNLKRISTRLVAIIARSSVECGVWGRTRFSVISLTTG
jgi:hypothetical protein